MYIYNCITDDTEITLARKIGYRQAKMDNDKRKIYYKDFSFNELIGEKLASKIKLDTVSNFFACVINESGIFPYSEIKDKYTEEQLDIMIASYDFKLPNVKYLELEDFSFKYSSDTLNNLLGYCPNEKNRLELIEEIMKMTAVDIRMIQEDRYFNNHYFAVYPNKEIHLAPLFDYESSFYPGIIAGEYESSFISFLDNKAYFEYFEKYPEFLEYFKFMQEQDLIKNIGEIEEEKHIIVPDNTLEFYKRREEEIQKQFRKILEL